VFTDAYNKGILETWYLLIDIPFIFLYIKFENELSASVLKHRTTHHEILQLEIVKFVHKKTLKARPPTPPFSNSCVRSKWSRLGSPVHFRTSKVTGAYSKE
jgi:hypothetical protein